MDELTIERTEARFRRIAAEFRDILSDAEAISKNGGDPSTSTELGNRQTHLQDEAEQLLSDVEYLVSTSDGIRGKPERKHPRDSVALSEDTVAESVTVSYSGSVDLDSTNVTVFYETNGGDRLETTERFSGTIVNGDTLTVDVSGFTSNDQIIVEWTTSWNTANTHSLPNNSRDPIPESSKQNLPPSELETKQTTFTQTLVLE